MFVARLTIESACGETIEAQDDEINTFLGLLRMDGRALGKELLLIQNATDFISILPVPAEDAFHNLNANEYLKKSLDKFPALQLKEPVVEIIGTESSENLACDCGEHSAFILFTNYVLLQSPLRCADCFLPVPLYKIPRFASGDYYKAICWQSDYKACDSLQMNCTVGEKFAMRQMSSLNSSLTKQGLEVCAEVTQLTNKICFYYLYKYNGKSDKKERERKCPSCGGEWLLQSSWHKLFDFRCDKCHLLSNIAVSLS